jgi:hypothetical protein
LITPKLDCEEASVSRPSLVLSRVGEALGAANPEVSFIQDGVRRQVPLSDAGAVRFEYCAPVRNFVSWPGKRNYSGSYAASTTQTHVGFESLFERTALMTLDRDASVVAISSQPMWIHWPAGSTPKAHAPDYFVRHSNGDGEVIDVRPERLIDVDTEHVFEVTRALCMQHNYRYRVVSNLSAALDHNLKFLSRYRHECWKPDVSRLVDALGRREIRSVRELADQLAGSGHDLAQGLGWTYWSIWHGIAKANLEQELSLNTWVS